MSRLQSCFENASKKGRKIFVAYLTAGDPELEKTIHYCHLLEKAGVDIIELGVPYSDPLADGPTNQAAAQRALASGTTLEGIFRMAKEAREQGLNVPLVLFSYVNPLLKMGWEKSAKKAQDCGIDGCLIVDLPPEEAKDYVNVLRWHNLESVFLVSPTTKPERYSLINSISSGFVYYVSRTGVTGVQNTLPENLLSEIEALKNDISKPLVVGFGISNPSQAAKIASVSDGIVIGSAIVNFISRIESGQASDDDLSSFVSSVREQMDKI